MDSRVTLGLFRYSSLQYIGEGAYGMVVSAYDNQTKTKVNINILFLFDLFVMSDFKGCN